VGFAKIDRGDPRRIGNQVGENIAATGCNRHDMARRRDRQRLHIDFRIFPDLRINQPIEQPGKQIIEHAFIREDAVRYRMQYIRLVNGLADAQR
jgi:hypothetical protein